MPASPAGAEAYDQEHSWNYEGGVKTSALGDRLTANVAAFHIDWSDLQVNVPNAQVPGQFFIGNAAGATSTGLEFELHARPDRASICSAASGSLTRAFPTAASRTA